MDRSQPALALKMVKSDSEANSPMRKLNPSFTPWMWVRPRAVDMAIECGSTPQRNGIVGFALLMVAVYPVGVPCVVGLMLWLRRTEIAERTTRSGEGLSTLSFLFRNYAPAFGWWMPVLDLVRRLWLSSFLLVFRMRHVQVLVALVGAVAFTVLFRELKPVSGC